MPDRAFACKGIKLLGDGDKIQKKSCIFAPINQLNGKRYEKIRNGMAVVAGSDGEYCRSK
jgi:hypothetical protein